MEVVNLVFAILGHVLASVLYVARRITFSSGAAHRPAIASKGAIDRSSIIERKEEIREQWEKKMMSGEHQDTQVDEKKPTKKDEEQAANEAVDVKMNGTVSQSDIKEVGDKSEPEGEPDCALQREEENKTDEKKLEKMSPDEEQVAVSDAEKEPQAVLVAESCDHRETETLETEEQIFTSTLQPALASAKSAEQEDAEVSAEKVDVDDEIASHEEFERLETKIEAEESLLLISIDEIDPKVNGTEKKVEEEVQQGSDEIHVEREMEAPETVDSPDSLEAIEIPDGGEDFQHFTVLESRPCENGTFKNNNLTNGFNSMDNLASDSEPKTFDDHFVLDTREAMSPIEDDDKKETTTKKSKLNNLGVQKTEQPYSTCTTETKIAMEIREMREREEELKLMRERQVLVSPVPPSPTKVTPVVNKAPVQQKPVQQPAYLMTNGNSKMNATPGYRVSSVFGHRVGPQQPKEENKFLRNKETAVEKEIRLARDREEELRKQKGLPPREDDPYVKPSEVKSSQAKAFGKMLNAENSRLMATAKIQHEIEEQTLREMALRESGHIQTLSSERTDSKVTKLKSLDSPECTSPTFTNGNKTGYMNGNHSNGYNSPEYTNNNNSKRSTPSPTGNNYYSQFSKGIVPASPNKGISMQKFISSRGKESTFAPPKNGLFQAKQENNNYSNDNYKNIPEPGKLKRTVSVESKIQQEILEMKLREEELKLLHTGGTLSPSLNGDEYDKSPMEYQDGDANESEEICPRRSNLIAQWEQRIQKSEGKA